MRIQWTGAFVVLNKNVTVTRLVRHGDVEADRSFEDVCVQGEMIREKKKTNQGFLSMKTSHWQGTAEWNLLGSVWSIDDDYRQEEEKRGREINFKYWYCVVTHLSFISHYAIKMCSPIQSVSISSLTRFFWFSWIMKNNKFANDKPQNIIYIYYDL